MPHKGKGICLRVATRYVRRAQLFGTQILLTYNVSANGPINRMCKSYTYLIDSSDNIDIFHDGLPALKKSVAVIE